MTSTNRRARAALAVVALGALAACAGERSPGGDTPAAARAAGPTTTAGGATPASAPTSTTSGAAAATTTAAPLAPAPADMQPGPGAPAPAGSAGTLAVPAPAPPAAPSTGDEPGEPPAPPAPPGATPPPAPSAPRPGNGTPTALGRCTLFPRSSYWYANVSTLPVHPRSADHIASIGAGGALKADFGSGLWDGGPIGIPYVVVPAGQAKVPLSFEYADESDPGPYPIPPDAPIEGGPASQGDRHILVVDQTDCRLYETWSTYPDGAGWRAGSGAVWDLASNDLRPDGWTSADAAGLPILPGLVRYDEVAAGRIDHAIRITMPRTRRAYVWPARHFASSRTDPALPPMGLWLRLRADVDLSGFPRDAQVILRALQQHGAIVADNGSAWYLSGAPDERWDNDVLATLRRIPGSAFEAVDTSSLAAHPDSGQVR